MPLPITGRCCCGAVRFQLDRPPIAVRACWCRDCQYLAAGNATVNAIFDADGLTCSGAVTEFVSTADSGSVMHRGFCPACGTPLFSRSDSRPHLVVVRVGALDDREIGGPSTFIWTASAPSWGHIDPALENHEGQASPPPSAT